MTPQTHHADICIIGAGPAGSAAALKLDRLGIPCVLVEKHEFPRDKVCGDAVGGKSIVNMKRIDPELLKRFYALPQKTGFGGIHVSLPSGKTVDFDLKGANYFGEAQPPGFVVRRIDFDNFLAEEVKASAHIEFLENTNITQFRRTGVGYELISDDGSLIIHTRLLIDASGAQSIFSRTIANLPKEAAHYAGSVRAYFSNVTDMHPNSYLELHYLPKLTPGYLWIFPLPNNAANVGLGIRSDHIKKKGFQLKKELLNQIKAHPPLRKRFAQATMDTPIKGFGLPFGSKIYPLSDDHYLLTGDAGHLVDPLTGEGIGHAFYSGVFAAEQAQKCLQQNDFSKEFLQSYDRRIRRVIGKEMKLSYRIQKLMTRPKVVDFMASIISGNQALVSRISAMIGDYDQRKRLVRPGFWLKALFIRRHSN